MKKKQVIRLTESDLHRVIQESVKKILKEEYKYWDEKNRIPNFTPSEKLKNNPMRNFLLGRMAEKDSARTGKRWLDTEYKKAATNIGLEGDSVQREMPMYDDDGKYLGTDRDSRNPGYRYTTPQNDAFYDGMRGALDDASLDSDYNKWALNKINTYNDYQKKHRE